MTIQLADWALNQRTDSPGDKLLLFLSADLCMPGEWVPIDADGLMKRADFNDRDSMWAAYGRLRTRKLLDVHGDRVSPKVLVKFAIDIERDVLGHDIRGRALRAFRLTCPYCEKAGRLDIGPDGAPWSLDRILPGARGGKYVAENVALSCMRCNAIKHDQFPWKPVPNLAELEAQP